jgi:F-type H+-transporting ATPase subunit b
MGQELIKPDFGLIFWTVLVFCALLFILGKLAWKPILKGLAKREQTIAEALGQAEQARSEMASMKTENERILNEAREERNKILRDAKEVSERIKTEAKETAKTEGARMLDEARREIENQKNAAMSEVKTLAADLSVQVAEKILRQELSADAKNEAYISKLVKDLSAN